MAANYWESTQRRYWLFTKEQLAETRQRLEEEDPGLVQMFPLPQQRHLSIHFNQQINRLGKRLGARQQAMATAQVYTKRFYTRVEIRRTNPYLLIATAVYLACKMEECPQHIRLVVQEARSLWPSEFHSQDTSKLGECEFFLISELSSQLIVHQPYRTLSVLQADFSLSQEEAAMAWNVINDHYMTDLPLLHPPHIIALVAVLFAMTLRPPQSSAGAVAAAGGAGGTVGGVASATTPSASDIVTATTAALAQVAQARSGLGVPGTPGGGTPGGMASSLVSQGSGGLQGMTADSPTTIGGVSTAAGGATTPTAWAAMSAAASESKKLANAAYLNKVHRYATWLADSSFDIEAIVDCTQELISFYECHEQYNDKHTREPISRFVKARGLDK